ncbi:peroxisomal sarcosine oxidase-like [Uloborus diversus]|uniref:peroxisomal sarcosine oxidase-like n=1 Tax=Uloborus diversus TaxID=327109 RepID=UPI00240A3690|nr:peroxisomal sarcosine oxidase-like [Uloborus diversus]
MAGMVKFNHVVVGAGIVGSWTALHLRNLGKKVLLLEQFGEPNTRASSHGQTRLVRSSYPEPFFAEMMPHAIKMWEDLEKETKKELLLKAPTLCVSEDPNNDDFVKSIENTRRLYPHLLEELKPGEIGSRFNGKLRYSDSTGAFIDKSGRVVKAVKSRLTVQGLFREKGGEMWENCEVLGITPQGDQVEVVCQKGKVTAESVVVCAGTWAKKLLTPHLVPDIPLQPNLVGVYYWKEKVKGAYSLSSGFSTFLDFAEPSVYCLPGHEYPGLVKVCIHKGTPCNPDERDRTDIDKDLEEILRKYVEDHMPLCDSSKPAIVERCMYTMTPDEIFLVDSVPGHKNIVFGAGFSGTGFKTSPAIGKMLSQMATGETPFLDPSPFSLSRFNKK